MSALSFHVVGLPAPQGSKRFVGKGAGGRGIMIESSKKVKPWREAVVAAALDVRPEVPLDGPLWLGVVFTMPKPKSAAKKRTCPDTMPDLSKLVRSTEDAITTAGLWVDDARVVECSARKVWHGHDDQALPIPGAVVVVAAIGSPEWRAHGWTLAAAARQAQRALAPAAPSKETP